MFLAIVLYTSNQPRLTYHGWVAQIGSFHTPPIRLLETLCSLWEWYESLAWDYPPANYLQRALTGRR